MSPARRDVTLVIHGAQPADVRGRCDSCVGATAVRRLMLSWLRPAAARVKRAGAAASTAAASATVAAPNGGSASAEDGM